MLTCIFLLLCKTKSEISSPIVTQSLVGGGHGREPARPRLEAGSSPLLVGARADQSGQGSLHPLTFDSTDSNQRVRHSRSAHVQPVRRIRSCVVTSANVLVKAAAKRPRMRRRRAHTGLLRHRDRAIFLRNGDGSIRVIRRDRTVVDGEADGWRRGGGGVQVDTCRGSGSVVMVVVDLLIVVVVVLVVAEEGGGRR